MQKSKLFLVSLSFLSFFQCTSVDQNIREHDRFSLGKNYAIIQFSCQDTETGLRVSDALREQLLDYGFNILDKTTTRKILSDAGLTEEEIVKDYSKALWKLKNVNAIIVGNIVLNRGLSSGQLMSSSSSGGFNDYIHSCVTHVVEIQTGEVISSAKFRSPELSSSSGTISPKQVAEKLARMLSPH
jgi:curli biogenesis system outer membrane secretion channel CsgG